MSTKTYDYFVIGAGSGGVRSARIAATHGAKVGIAEKADYGGTCVNLGCVPKKIMAYGSDMSMAFDDAGGYGWAISSAPKFNWKTLIKNKDAEISRLNGIYENILNNAGVDIHKGHAKFIDPNTVEIDGQKIKAKNFLIAVGGRPRTLDGIEGAEHAVTSDDVFHLKTQPKRVVILGGGYIAVEFAHIFHGFGSHVDLLYRGDMFMRGFDDDVRLHLADEMRKSGVGLHFKNNIPKIEKKGKGFIVHTTQGQTIPCDLVLSAIGRDPVTDLLDLDKAGVKTDRNGYIKVDGKFRTNVKHIHAVGDISSPYQLTPVAIAEGHTLAERLYGKSKKKRKVSYNNIATAVFSQPPIATVGLTEEQALDQGLKIDVYKSTFRPMKHVLPNRDEKTMMKLIVDKKTDRVLGLHMVGLDAPEMMQGFAVAMNAGATKADFDRTIGIHPTSAEELVTMREPQIPPAPKKP